MILLVINILYLFCLKIHATEESSETSIGIPGTSYRKWTWTDWFDTEYGPHQTETYEAIIGRGWKICHRSKVVQSECQREDNGEKLSNGFSFNTTNLIGQDIECNLHGIECHIVNCINFKVRFLCEEVVVETGSAIFYFTMLAVPLALILFRLYCWEIIKRRMHKRLMLRRRNDTSDYHESTDLSHFYPPTYDELFGTVEACSSLGVTSCRKCNHSVASNVCSKDNQTDHLELKVTIMNCKCKCHRKYVTSASGLSTDIQNESLTIATAGISNPGYQHDGINSSEISNTAASIFVISHSELPPPTYSEALVILKREEGIDATHL